MSIGSRLRIMLKRAGMTQAQLAGKLDISTSTLNGYITDYREPDARMLARLAKELDTTVDFLINGTEATSIIDSYQAKVKVIAHNEGVALTPAQEDAIVKYMKFLVSEDKDV